MKIFFGMLHPKKALS